MQLEPRQKLAVPMLVSPQDRLKWFDQYASDLVTFVEHAGLSHGDARATVMFIRASLQSTAEDVESYLHEVRGVLVKQAEINKQFIEMYSLPMNARLMVTGVKSGLGSLATAPEFDKEALAAEGWMYLFRRMSAGTYVFRSDKEQGGFIKSCGKNTGWAAAQNYRRRLKNIQKGLPSLEAAMPHGYATSREDVDQVQPDPSKASVGDD
jgi:hypothetical protein